MKKLPVLLAAGIFFSFSTAIAEEGPWSKDARENTPDSYLCAGDDSAGFAYIEKKEKWRRATFNIENQRYILSKSESISSTTDKPLITWDLKRTGEESSIAESSEGFSKDGKIRCEGSGHFFFMNNKNLRFLLIYYFGYWNGKDNRKDTPAMIKGTCKPS
jgi:hypothetical protein